MSQNSLDQGCQSRSSKLREFWGLPTPEAYHSHSQEFEVGNSTNHAQCTTDRDRTPITDTSIARVPAEFYFVVSDRHRRFRVSRSLADRSLELCLRLTTACAIRVFAITTRSQRRPRRNYYLHAKNLLEL